MSGKGHYIGVHIIVPGTVVQERWITETGLANDTLISVTESGYSNDEISLDWIKHFENQTRARTKGTKRLLLLDGYGSHCTREFIEFCDSHRIILYCLIPHTTGKIQPLDVGVFQPYKHFHAKAVDDEMLTGCDNFDVVEFLAAIGKIRRQALKVNTIKSAWRKSGLIPYNPSIVIDANCRPKTPPPEEEMFRPCTPSRGFDESSWIDNLTKTPTTPRSSALCTEYLMDAVKRTGSPRFNRILDAYIKSSEAERMASVVLDAKLRDIEAAQKARQRRKMGSRQ